ncbi:uncharacterized protein LOC115954522 [Quercus lobata]|uniref:Uncharacterized protein n=1 Tax=Quercus lobata TaxID=97700 RepID=A0A7N2ME74_QUELO|nr:uncharacterized protein LOC115954522 [Quercus lobata]
MKRRVGSSEEEEEENEELERDVKQMAEKLLQYRTTLPDHLRSTFTSVLTAQRPVLPPPSESTPSGAPIPDAGGQVKSIEGLQDSEQDQEIAEKLQLLKDKISSNVSAMPIVLKRMKECISKIDKLDSYNGIIHPAFKRKKTS